MKVGELWKGPEIKFCNLCDRRLSFDGQAIVSETTAMPKLGVVTCLGCFDKECVEKGEELVWSREGWRKVRDLWREEVLDGQ